MQHPACALFAAQPYPAGPNRACLYHHHLRPLLNEGGHVRHPCNAVIAAADRHHASQPKAKPVSRRQFLFENPTTDKAGGPPFFF